MSLDSFETAQARAPMRRRAGLRASCDRSGALQVNPRTSRNPEAAARNFCEDYGQVAGKDSRGWSASGAAETRSPEAERLASKLINQGIVYTVLA
jgi:hypothetical protein